jgi:hypothetical protein
VFVKIGFNAPFVHASVFMKFDFNEHGAGPACDVFENWNVSDHPQAQQRYASGWFSCGDENLSLAHCPHFSPENISIPWSSVVRQGRMIYQEGAAFPATYGTEEVEGTSLVLGNGEFGWMQMRFQVQLINFGDDWIGASFRYRNDDNYYRFEMSRVFGQEGVVRLKRSKNGVKKTLWDAAFKYKKGQFYTLRVEDFTDQILVYLDEGLDSAAPKESWTPMCGRISDGTRTCVFHDSEIDLISGTIAMFESGGSSVYFMDPRIQSPYRVAKHSNILPRSGNSVTVHGHQFTDICMQARLHSTSAEASSWVSTSSIECKSMGWQHPFGGLRGSMHVMITAGKTIGSATEALSYDGPNVYKLGDWSNYSVYGQNAASMGAQNMTVYTSRYLGSNGLSTFYASNGMARSHTAAEWSQWMSDTALHCLRARGIYATLRVSVTSGEKVASLTEAYSTDSVVLSRTSPQNAAATGSTSMTIFGAGLGYDSYTMQGRVAQTGCEGTEWESDTSVRCAVGNGVRGTRPMMMTAGERAGSTSAPISFDSGSLSALRRSNSAGTGSAPVTVHGAGLGLVAFTALGRIGQTGCEGTEWESETSVRCLAGHISQQTRGLTLTSGILVGSMSEAFSLDLSLSVVQRANMASTGSASVTVHGSSLGLAAFTALGRIGQTGCEGTEWESETSVRCLVGRGLRGTRRVMMTTGERGGSGSAMYSIDTGRMSMTRGSNRAGTGSASVTVHGAGLGLVAFTALGRGGQTGCEGTEWESETSVRCLVGRGLRGTRRVMMTAGERGGSGSAMYSIDAGRMSMTRGSNRAGTGSALVTVHGAGLGLVAFTALGRGGQTGCEGTEWESETSVRCLMGRGLRGTRRVMMTTGERGGSGSAMYSIDAGRMSMTRGSNRAGTGSASVSVNGAGLGLVAFTTLGRGGQTGCEGTEWESETSIRCLVGHGVRGTRPMMMTAGERAGSTSAPISFDSGSLSALRRSNSAGTGSAPVTVHGAGLGLVAFTALGRIGQTGCEGTEWESETSVRCLAGHISQQTRGLTLTSGILVGSMSEAFSLDLSLSVVQRANMASTGSASVTVHGSSLGLAAFTALGRIGQTGCEGTEWESETSVRCLVGRGLRGTRRVMMTTGERGGSGSAMYSIDAGRMSMTRGSNRAGTGSASVTVHGAGLGLVAFTALGRGGQTGCEGTEWESETSVRCLMGRGLRGTRRVMMTTGERGGSGSAMYSIDAGRMSMTRGSNRAGTGSASVTVHGAGLGLVAFTTLGRGGQTGCEGTEWESETSIRCLVGHGVRGTRPMMMTAGERAGSTSAPISFDSGSLSALRRSNSAGTGSAPVTVHGAGLGLVAFTALGRIGQTGCEGTEWESETSVRCLAGHISQQTRGLTLTSGILVGSMSEAFSLDLSLSVMQRANMVSTGSASVTVHGSSLGLAAFTALGRIGQTGCEGTEWESETSVRCLVGRGLRGTRRVMMTTGERGGTGSAMYSIDAGRMSMTRGSNRAGTGSASVTVHGAGLGLVAFTALGRGGQTGCEGTEWESETSVRCLMGRGLRGTRRVMMTTGERGGSGSAMYSIDAGRMSMTRGSNRAGTGSASVSVNGAGLGLVAFTTLGRGGQTGCEGTEWESETSIRCLVGHGVRGTRPMMMTAGERAGSTSAPISFDSGSLSALRRSNSAGTGSAPVTVHGAGLGLVAFTALGRIGQTGCEGTEWESETSVRCLAGHISQQTRGLTLTSGILVGSMSEAFSLDLSLSVMQRANMVSTGSASVTVHGSSLGLAAFTALGRIGQTGCEGTEWESETSVRCLVGRGLRGTRRVMMTTGERGGTGSAMYSIDAGRMSMTRGSNRAGTGSASVTVHGAGLGLVAFTTLGRGGQTGCEGTEWESETSIRCLVGHGVRGTRPMMMTAGERAGSTSAPISFDSGSLSALRRSNSAGTGSAPVTVHGAGLGLVAFTALGRIGQTGCEGTEWESETSVRCLAGHISQQTRGLTLTSGILVGSMSEAFSLDLSLSVVQRANMASTGSASVTVHGSSLGLAAFTALGRIGQTGCEGTEWESETSVRCLIGQAVRGTRQLMMTTGGGSGSGSAMYSADVASISVIRPSNHAGRAVSSQVLWVGGGGFGFASPVVRAGGTACEASEWKSMTTIICRVSDGVAGKHQIAFTSGERASSATGFLSFDIPSLVSFDSSSSVLTGRNFGVYASSLRVQIGATYISVIMWTSDSSVACHVSQAVTPVLASVHGYYTGYFRVDMGTDGQNFTLGGLNDMSMDEDRVVLSWEHTQDLDLWVYDSTNYTNSVGWKRRSGTFAGGSITLENVSRRITSGTPIPDSTTNMTAYRGTFGIIYSIPVTGATGMSGDVWGSDNYTDHSSIQKAAVHAGVVQDGENKTVYIEMLPGQQSYTGTTRNSVTSSSHNEEWPGTYRFRTTTDSGDAMKGPAVESTRFAGLNSRTLEIWVNYFSGGTFSSAEVTDYPATVDVHCYQCLDDNYQQKTGYVTSVTQNVADLPADLGSSGSGSGSGSPAASIKWWKAGQFTWPSISGNRAKWTTCVSDCFMLPEFDDLMLDAETCCAGECKLTFAPLTNTNESTALTDPENGTSYDLDRQDVSCLSDPMAAFVMETSACQNDDDWVDDNDNGCDYYEDYPSECDSADDFADDFGVDATDKCCICNITGSGSGGQMRYEIQCAKGADLDLVQVPC